LAVTIFLLSGTSFNAPADWNSGDNTVECIGGGQAGFDGVSANNSGGDGGDGGDYARVSSLSLTPNSTVHYAVGAGGASNGAVGGDTYFGAPFVISASVVAKGGGSLTTSAGDFVRAGGVG